MYSTISKFKEKLNSKAGVLGTFLIITDPAIAESTGYAGYDFCVLDMEHGPTSNMNMQNMIRGAQLGGLMPIIRVPRGMDIWICKALDLGAGGVMVPQIDSADQAAAAVNAAKYSPMGSRGIAGHVRAAHYSAVEPSLHFKKANETMVIIQIEGKKALGDLENILKVKGIDLLFIGPNDLASSLGVIGQVHHPTVQKCIMDIITASSKNGIAVGLYIDNVEEVKLWRDLGVKFFAASSDTSTYYNASRRNVDLFKKL